MPDRIEGCWAAAATPLAADGSVDHDSLILHAKWLIEHGCDGVVLFGTTGEGPSFSAPERIEALEAVLAAGIPPSQLCMSTGFPAIPDSIALTKETLGHGLKHALILPPYFFRDAPAEGLTDAFSAIIDAVGDDRLRVTLYHIPQTSGVAIPPAVLAALRTRYGRIIAGLKDSSGDFSHFRAFRAACPEAGILVGNEIDLGRAVAEGSPGTICGMVNVVPELVQAMFTHPDAEAPMTKAVQQMLPAGFVQSLKAAMASLTGNPGWNRLRAPLRPLDDAAGARIAAVIKTCRFPA